MSSLLIDFNNYWSHLTIIESIYTFNWRIDYFVRSNKASFIITHLTPSIIRSLYLLNVNCTKFQRTIVWLEGPCYVVRVCCAQSWWWRGAGGRSPCRRARAACTAVRRFGCWRWSPAWPLAPPARGPYTSQRCTSRYLTPRYSTTPLLYITN